MSPRIFPPQNIPFSLLVSLELVPGASTRFIGAENVAVTTTVTDIWNVPATTLIWPTVATVIAVVSTDAGDTGAGAGARSLFLRGLDASFALQEETITLNGLTPVNTVGTYIRLNTMNIISVGTLEGGNLGLIDATIGGNIQGRIGVGDGAMQKSHYTTPSGAGGIILRFVGSAEHDGTKDIDFVIFVRTAADAIVAPFGPRFVLSSFSGTQATFEETYVVPPVIPEKADIWATAVTDQQTAVAGVGLDLIETVDAKSVLSNRISF